MGPTIRRSDFYDHFRGDGLKTPDKPEDVFSEQVSDETLLKRRTEYDEFILYVDQEFGRFYDDLERSGLLENSWVVLTSDHGEMFERGISAHSTNALYQPVIRIPLLILEPGREPGVDIQVSTSAVDVLPTSGAGNRPPHSRLDRRNGPASVASDNADPNRNLYVVRATKNDQAAPLTHASTTMVKGRYKLLYFFGYPDRGIDELVKLYDIQADPEEMQDLSVSQKDVAAELLGELKSRSKEVNSPYL